MRLVVIEDGVDASSIATSVEWMDAVGLDKSVARRGLAVLPCARRSFQQTPRDLATARPRNRVAEARRNRTNPSTLPRRNNGFEDRGGHQTPFASIPEGADGNVAARGRYCI